MSPTALVNSGRQRGRVIQFFNLMYQPPRASVRFFLENAALPLGGKFA